MVILIVGNALSRQTHHVHHLIECQHHLVVAVQLFQVHILHQLEHHLRIAKLDCLHYRLDVLIICQQLLNLLLHLMVELFLTQ